MRLQTLYGGAAIVKGKGPAAGAVRSLLMRMRQELGPEAPVVGAAFCIQYVTILHEQRCCSCLCFVCDTALCARPESR